LPDIKRVVKEEKIGGICITRGRKYEMHSSFLAENRKARDHLGRSRRKLDANIKIGLSETGH
jgi:hypothetical protein